MSQTLNPDGVLLICGFGINMSGKVTSSQCVNNRSDRLRSRGLFQDDVFILPGLPFYTGMIYAWSGAAYRKSGYERSFVSFLELLGATAVKKVKNATLGVHPDILTPERLPTNMGASIQQKYITEK
ncbi:hypothetical protein Tco_1514172, partial [Tanacetum coccineum]